MNILDFSGEPVHVINAAGTSRVVLVCEHASAHIPDEFENLGLEANALQSHAAFDLGAYVLALKMSELMDATLVASGVSRLIYDCNRPPDAPGAVPEVSEIYEIPGNAGLDEAARHGRAARYYEPFRAALAETLSARQEPVLVTVHSFTPTYHGVGRDVEIGVLHDDDSRLADVLIGCSADRSSANIQRNEPYGPQDGVTHTLREHALRFGRLNCMIEVRNDLLVTQDQQDGMAGLLSKCLTASLKTLLASEVSACQA